MLSSYRDLSSITDTIDEVTEEQHEEYMKKRRRSGSHFELEKVSILGNPGDMEPLPKWRKICFGVGNFSRATVSAILVYFLNIFLLEVALIDPFWTGNVLFVKQIYDAVTDLIVRCLSDSIETPFGRRKVWIFLFVIPAGITWIAFWYTPSFTESDMVLSIVYFLLLLLAFNTFNTFLSVPYNSLVSEISIDYNDRKTIVLYQELFGLCAVVIFSFFQGAIIDYFKEDNSDLINYQKGYFVAALFSVWAIIIPIFFAILFVKENKQIGDIIDSNGDLTNESTSLLVKIYRFFACFLRVIGRSLIFKEFALLVIVFILCMISDYLFTNNLVLYIKYVLKVEHQTPYILVLVQTSSAVSIFLWGFASRMAGKRLTFVVGCSFWIGGSMIMFFIGADNIEIFYLVSIFRAVGTGVGYFIPLAMLPDIAELDRLQNKVNRSKEWHRLVIMLKKISIGVAMLVSNYILGGVGYLSPIDATIAQQESAYQSSSVQLAFRIIMMIVPTVCLLCAVIVIVFINISPERFSELESNASAKDFSFKPKTSSVASIVSVASVATGDEDNDSVW